MRSVPFASLLLALVLGLVFGGTLARTLATQPHVDGALAAFEHVRQVHPEARISGQRLGTAHPRVQLALAALRRDQPVMADPAAGDILLEMALRDVLRASARLPQNVQGYSPSAPTLQGALLSMWTHLTFPALVGNLVLLLLFGGNAERRWGRWAPPILFIAGGLGGLAAHHLLAPAMMGPLIGASGGVFGLLGALMAPSSEPVHNRIGPLPAWSVALFLLLLEGLAAAFEMAPSMSHAAHLGGLIVGMALGFVIERTGVLSPSVSITKA